MDVEQTGSPAPDSGGGGSNVAGTPNTAPADPQVIEIPDDNAMVRVKGLEKPVKFSEIRGFQSRWTQESQKRAQLEKAVQERDARIKQYEQERLRASQQQQGQRPDPFAQIRELPYLNGEQAAQVVQSISQQMNQRDQLIIGLARELQRTQQIVQQLHGSHSSSAFESKIDRFLSEGGYDPAFKDLAKEIYLAYEGDDLDTEYPSILAKRIEQVEAAIEAKKRAALERNRPARFVPGKGGNAGPSNPLQIKPDASPKDIAEQLWATMQNDGT